MAVEVYLNGLVLYLEEEITPVLPKHPRDPPVRGLNLVYKFKENYNFLFLIIMSHNNTYYLTKQLNDNPCCHFYIK